jgi:hypothetical protein
VGFQWSRQITNIFCILILVTKVDLNGLTLRFLTSVGNPRDAMEAVAKIASEPFVPGNLENYHIIEHPAGHIALKRLITNDKQRMQANETGEK